MQPSRFGLIFVLVGLGVAASGPTGSESQRGARDQSHTLKLTAFAIPPGAPLGLLLKVRIDNGPVLRLLLDSGAEFIVLDKKAAAQSGHANGSEFDLVGMGGSPKAARMAQAGTVAVGDLVFQDCRLIIAAGKMADGVDGVIPLSLFAGFLMRLDLPGKKLDLRPYPPAGSVEDRHLLAGPRAKRSSVYQRRAERLAGRIRSAGYRGILQRDFREYSTRPEVSPVVRVLRTTTERRRSKRG